MHKLEQRKFGYLTAKFLAKLRAGGGIYVVKANTGVSIDDARRLHVQLSRLAQGAPFWLLVVNATPDASLWGQVRPHDGAIFEGFIDRFAHYSTADDFSTLVWDQLLEAMLAIAPFPDWHASQQKIDAVLAMKFRQLPFPEGGASLGQAERSTGMSVMASSANSWSRRLHNFFRLHASQNLSRPSTIEWRAIPLNGQATTLQFSYQLSTGQSRPVILEARVTTDENMLLANRFTQIIGSAGEMCLSVPANYPQVNLLIEARCDMALGDGEIAAADIFPVDVFATGSMA